MTLKLSNLYTEQNNESYVAVCPELKGCFTQGDTLDQAIFQIKDLIRATIDQDLSEEELSGLTQVKTRLFSEYELVV